MLGVADRMVVGRYLLIFGVLQSSCKGRRKIVGFMTENTEPSIPDVGHAVGTLGEVTRTMASEVICMKMAGVRVVIMATRYGTGMLRYAERCEQLDQTLPGIIMKDDYTIGHFHIAPGGRAMAHVLVAVN